MSAGLIKHLKRKTEDDSNTRILMSQWDFDEKLVGKSLENVGSYYPHFSSHNESHSQQILVNIERLLGSNIDKLTATDTWLILEAAYWHDIGMLFNADEVQKVFEELDSLEIAITENKFDISSMISNPIHLSLLLNLFNENYYTDFHTTDEWKKLSVLADYTIEDVLNLKSFTVTWNPTTIKQLPDNINISNNIDSETMKLLVEKSKFLQKAINESGFHSYIFKDASYSGAYSIRNTLYSKTEIDDNLFKNIRSLWEDSEEEDEDDYSLDYIFDLDVDPLFFPHKIEPLVSARDFIDTIFNKKNNSTYDGLFFIKYDEEIFLFPYIEDNGRVIEIANIMLFKLVDSFLEINFEKFDKLYNEIKEQILNKAKNSYPNWYKAYERGQSFKPIDLAFLDKLHKPTT